MAYGACNPSYAIDANFDATLDTSHRAGAAGSPKANVRAEIITCLYVESFFK